MPPQVCPNCGAAVPRSAKACPGCGSDEQTGWSDEVHASGLDLPDEKFDYGEFVNREFGRETPKPHGLHWAWWLVGIALLIALLLAMFR